MRFLRRFYIIAATAIMVVSALFRLVIGASMMATSVWLGYQGRGSMVVIAVMALFVVGGFVIFVRALEPLVGKGAPRERKV
jgi:hypothetical protein